MSVLTHLDSELFNVYACLGPVRCELFGLWEQVMTKPITLGGELPGPKRNPFSWLCSWRAAPQPEDTRNLKPGLFDSALEVEGCAYACAPTTTFRAFLTRFR